MSSSNTPDASQKESAFWKLSFVVLMGVIGFLVVSLIAMLSNTSPFLMIDQTIDKLFKIDTVQSMWYITRAAGLVAYVLLWLSTVWGLAVSSKIIDPLVQRGSSYDFHQILSLLSIAFIVIHIVVLMFDQYLPYTLAQILIPFTSPYRSVPVGIGVIALYLTVLVSITFYIRRWIGQKTFRTIHYLSLIAFVGSAVHGLLSGTDSPLWTVQALYVVTSLSVVFLTVYRIAAALPKQRQPYRY
jgi:methionine sulfoxide reductase heme-binding subunit